MAVLRVRTCRSHRVHAAKTEGEDLKAGGDANANPDEWGEFLHLPGQKFYDFNKIREEIVRDTEAKTGKKVGIVSRSGTLTYEAVWQCSTRGIGQTTCVGIGGDPVKGTEFIDVLELFLADPKTESIVMIGEIGGDAEERAAEYIKANVTKPVVGYVAGFTAPEGKTMGHAGAIVSGSSGTAQAKKEALEAAGVKVGKTPSETAQLMREIFEGK